LHCLQRGVNRDWRQCNPVRNDHRAAFRCDHVEAQRASIGELNM
jgi:hypothetical protein